MFKFKFSKKLFARKTRVIAILCTLVMVFLSNGCTDTYNSEDNQLKIPLSGKIVDSKGEGIEAALVYISGQPQISIVKTSENGSYLLTGVPLGNIQLIVEKEGFQSVARSLNLGSQEEVTDENVTLYKSLDDIFITKYSDSLAQICWTSVRETSSYAEYGTNNEFTKNVSSAASSVKHGLFITGLVSSVEYTSRVKFDGGLYSDPLVFTLNDSKFPKAPYLKSPLEVNYDSIKLGWTRESDNDFKCYRVLKSKTDPVSYSSTEIAVIEDRDVTTFTDKGLTSKSIYYYRVLTEFNNSFSTASQQIQVITEDTPNDPPSAVDLRFPSESTNSSVTLLWDISDESDFESYRIYYSKEPDVTTSDTLGTKIDSMAVKQGFVQGLEPATTYYFRVFVYDTGGLNAGSNEVFIATDSFDQVPIPVFFSSINAIGYSAARLEWSKAVDSDFQSYRIYRSTGPNVNTNNFMVVEINDYNTLEFVDKTLTEGILYYYRIYVFDMGGNSMGSNETSIVMPNEFPPYAQMEIINADENSVTLEWGMTSINDFAHYGIYRSENPGINNDSANLIGMVTQRDVTTFTDNNDSLGLTTGKTYYYRLYVFDLGGLAAPSAEQAASTIDKNNFYGDINDDMTISKANSPLVVTGDIEVASGVVLTVMKGVSIEITPLNDVVGTNDPLRTEITIRGSLIVKGYPDEHVSMRSASGVSANPGDWGGLIIDSSVRDCFIDRLSVKDAVTGITLKDDDVLLRHCNISNSSGDGLIIDGGDPEINNCTISSNNQAGVKISNGNPKFNGCNIMDNQGMAIYGGGGIIGTPGVVTPCYIARNNGSADVDTSGQVASFPLGLEDGTMDTDSDAAVLPQQIDNVDVIYGLVYDPVIDAGL